MHYTITVSLNHEERGRKRESITNIKPYLDNYNLEGINYSLEKDDWKKIGKNNRIIAVNVLYVFCMPKKKNMSYPSLQT